MSEELAEYIKGNHRMVINHTKDVNMENLAKDYPRIALLIGKLLTEIESDYVTPPPLRGEE